MIAYDRTAPLVSIHIPKTGGTSFRRNLEAWFGRKLYFHYKDEASGRMPDKARVHRRWGSGYRRDVCIHGHFNRNVGLGILDYYPEARQFITWVRDPVEVQVSLFSHQLRVKGGALYREDGLMKQTRDIDEFLEKSRCTFFNHFPRPVTAETLDREVENCFIHVGVIERAAPSLEAIADKLGRRVRHVYHENTSARPQKASESAMRAFREKSALEYRLFDMALRMNGG